MPDDKQLPEKARAQPVHDESAFSVLLDTDRFVQIQRVGAMFAESELVPDIFQGKPANCVVALQMAFRLQIDPMMLMQNMYVVYGRPGIEAKLAIALMNSRGPFTGPLQWKEEGQGDERSWTCYATHRVTNEKCSATVTWRMVKAEGWDKARGGNKPGSREVPSKWTTIPEIMGRYRSAMFLGRLYCPEVLLGLPTKEELEDDLTERTVLGTRLDGGAELMPRATRPAAEPERITGTAQRAQEPAKATETASSEPAPRAAASAQPAAASAVAAGPRAQAAQAPQATANVDRETGEIQTTDEGKTTLGPGADLIDAAVASDPMAGKRIASKAQRDMISGIAEKHCGLNAQALDEKLADRFACNLATLPMMMVNDAISFVRTLRPGT